MASKGRRTNHANSERMTTNDTRETMRERYDPRLLDRIAESGVAYALKGASMRRKGGGF